jgi:hypothetical protein
MFKTSEARACQSENDVLYRVDVKRVMCWEYGVEPTRTDWVAEQPKWPVIEPRRLCAGVWNLQAEKEDPSAKETQDDL